MNEQKIKTNSEINQTVNQPYKYGFITEIETENFPNGLNDLHIIFFRFRIRVHSYDSMK